MASTRLPAFPLGKTGGLIEALTGRNLSHGQLGFPLGKTGGLIEASCVTSQRTPTRSFRWVKPAASLKRQQETAARASGRAFPLGKTGGLIEAA